MQNEIAKEFPNLSVHRNCVIIKKINEKLNEKKSNKLLNRDKTENFRQPLSSSIFVIP